MVETISKDNVHKPSSCPSIPKRPQDEANDLNPTVRCRSFIFVAVFAIFICSICNADDLGSGGTGAVERLPALMRLVALVARTVWGHYG